MSQGDNARNEKTLSTLMVAHAVKTSRRFIQSLVAECQDTVATNCPQLLQNDNKDQTQRGLAAAYYSHVCSLDQPLFDCTLIEARTSLFFRCFEEQCAVFKSLGQPPDNNQETNYVVGQWYKVDSRAMKVENSDEGMTNATHTARTGMTPGTITSGTSRATTATGARNKSSQISGIYYYFLGAVTLDEEHKGSGIRIIPTVIVAQASEISELNTEMSDVGLTLQEVGHMEKVVGAVEVPQKEVPEKISRKKSSVKLLKSTSFLHSATSSTTNLSNALTPLRNQVEVATKSALSKWNVAVHKLEALLTKSAKLVTQMTTKGGRFRGEVKANSLSNNSATALSHLLSLQFGICEKDENLASFLMTISPMAPAKKADPSSLPSLKN